jgi:hypothetical protein
MESEIDPTALDRAMTAMWSHQKAMHRTQGRREQRQVTVSGEEKIII